MTKTCNQCQQQFEIRDQDLEFYDKVSPVFNGKKYVISPPNLCPDCRQQRRLSFRNERNMYNRGDSISIYQPNSSYTIYDSEYWWGDKWNAMRFGREIRWDTSLINQFQNLMLSVPRVSLFTKGCENCDYTNHSSYSKNSYLQFNFTKGEHCYYGSYMLNCKDCYDCLSLFDSELCIECIHGHRNYNCAYTRFCEDCSDCGFLFNCKNCSSCFMCANIQNKSYHILNKAYTKQKYEEEIKKYRSGSHKAFLLVQQLYRNFLLTMVYRATMQKNTEDSSGDLLENSKNCNHSYFLVDGYDCSYCYDGFSMKDSFDCYETALDVEQVYEAHASNSSKFSAFINICYESNNLYYCDFVHNSHHCFACSNMHNTQYCILNKQYSKEEYESLVPRIIEKMMKDGEWGEFFPPQLSPFGYNETVAQEYYPLTKEEAKAKGFNWSDYEPPPPIVDKILTQDQMKKLPDKTSDIPDDILNWALTCEVSNKPYRIIKQELAFYREHNLPIPRRHPDQRHKDRMALRNPRKLFNRTCMKCERPIQTTYSPDHPEIVYCEECYLKEVY